MKISLLLVITILLVPMILSHVQALQEVAGKVDIQLTPGMTKSFQWGFLSDSSNVTTLQLTAQGQGSEFLSFPKSIDLNAHALKYINVTVNVPSTFPGNVKLTPTLYATQVGQHNGPTIINIQVAKMTTLTIGPNPNPQIAAMSTANSDVPEFGPISGAVLVFALVGILVISRQTGSNRLQA